MSGFRKFYLRMIVAVATGGLIITGFLLVFNTRWFLGSSVGSLLLDIPDSGNELFVALIYGLFPSLGAVSVYHVLTVKYGGLLFDTETRCRKCGYILRGITEPRCPECGERI